MGREPASLRLLPVLLAGALTVSGCVTTYVVSRPRLLAVAGLPEDQEAVVQSEDSYLTVSGSSRCTLLAGGGTAALWTPNPNSLDGGYRTASDVRLSSLRREAGALVLSETGESVPLDNLGGAKFTKDQTVGVVFAIAFLTALVVAVTAVLTAQSVY